MSRSLRGPVISSIRHRFQMNLDGQMGEEHRPAGAHETLHRGARLRVRLLVMPSTSRERPLDGWVATQSIVQSRLRVNHYYTKSLEELQAKYAKARAESRSS